MAIPDGPDFVQAAPIYRGIQWDGADATKAKITQFMAKVTSTRDEFLTGLVQHVNEDGSFTFDEQGLFNWLSTISLNDWLIYGPIYGGYYQSGYLATMHPADFAARFPDWSAELDTYNNPPAP